MWPAGFEPAKIKQHITTRKRTDTKTYDNNNNLRKKQYTVQKRNQGNETWVAGMCRWSLKNAPPKPSRTLIQWSKMLIRYLYIQRDSLWTEGIQKISKFEDLTLQYLTLIDFKGVSSHLYICRPQMKGLLRIHYLDLNILSNESSKEDFWSILYPCIVWIHEKWQT